jgi:hypothetical protein
MKQAVFWVFNNQNLLLWWWWCCLHMLIHAPGLANLRADGFLRSVMLQARDHNHCVVIHVIYNIYCGNKLCKSKLIYVFKFRRE